LRRFQRLIKAISYRILAVTIASVIGYLIGFGWAESIISAVIIEFSHFALYYYWDTMWEMITHRRNVKSLKYKEDSGKLGEKGG